MNILRRDVYKQAVEIFIRQIPVDINMAPITINGTIGEGNNASLFFKMPERDYANKIADADYQHKNELTRIVYFLESWYREKGFTIVDSISETL